MDIYDFIALTNDQQLDTVGTKGVFLSGRKNADHRITLYQVDDFYVEVYFHLHDLQITMLSAIHSTCIQDLYYDMAPMEAHEPEPKKDYTQFFPNITFPKSLQSGLS